MMQSTLIKGSLYRQDTSLSILDCYSEEDCHEPETNHRGLPDTAWKALGSRTSVHEHCQLGVHSQ